MAAESLALYQYLCQVIGTEEQVRTRRVLSSANDYVSSSIESTMITSGSRGEGLNLPSSDYDFMYVDNENQVNEDLINVPEDTEAIVMDTIDTKKGFAKLRLVNCQNDGIIDIGEREMEGFYFSNSWLKELLKDDEDCCGLHGPCALFMIAKKEIDFAMCFRCKSWIEEAKEWVFRSRGNWPRSDVIEEIIKYGVLFVPIGVKGSTKEHLEYRISFSMAEKQLIFSFNHTQLLVYGMMKILLKDIINKRCEIKDLLCSYFIKTILFWEIEGSTVSDWVPCNLISCFMSCFRRLIYNVEDDICLHYFIPENNLFENRFNNNERETLLKTLKCLFNDGWKCILPSQLMSDFSLSKLVFNIGPQLNRSQITDKVTCLLEFNNFFKFLFDDTKEENLHKLSFTHYMPLLYTYRDILLIIRSQKCQEILTLLPLDTRNNNKNAYRQYKTILPYILQGTHHDAVSGWLLLASLFYRMKKYRKALELLSYVMTKFTSDKLYWNSESTESQIQSITKFIPEDMTVLNFLKSYTVDAIYLSETTRLCPALQQNCNHRTYIPPLVFGIILTFLCHYNTGNIIKCKRAVKNLQRTIEEGIFISGEVETSTSYEYLGLVLKLLHRNEEAQQAYTKALEIVCDYDCENCKSRLLSIIDLLYLI